MKKEEALILLSDAVKIYNNNLLNKQYMFIYSDNKKNYSIETIFLDIHFKHLTGVKNNLSPKDFYRQTLLKKLSPNDISFCRYGTTELKLKIIPSLFNIQNIAKMIGIYNKNNLTNVLLYTDKLLGNNNHCIGFVKQKGKSYYIPNTTLKADIRDITLSTNRVICIFKKNRADKLYNEICYVAKGLDIKEIDFKKEILSKLDGKLLAEIKPLEKNQLLENKKPSLLDRIQAKKLSKNIQQNQELDKKTQVKR